MLKITKFGGSSVANAEQFKKIKAIIQQDPTRRYIVVTFCGRQQNHGSALLVRCPQKIPG